MATVAPMNRPASFWQNVKPTPPASGATMPVPLTPLQLQSLPPVTGAAFVGVSTGVIGLPAPSSSAPAIAPAAPAGPFGLSRPALIGIALGGAAIVGFLYMRSRAP